MIGWLPYSWWPPIIGLLRYLRWSPVGCGWWTSLKSPPLCCISSFHPLIPFIPSMLTFSSNCPNLGRILKFFRTCKRDEFESQIHRSIHRRIFGKLKGERDWEEKGPKRGWWRKNANKREGMREWTPALITLANTQIELFEPPERKGERKKNVISIVYWQKMYTLGYVSNIGSLWEFSHSITSITIQYRNTIQLKTLRFLWILSIHKCG